MMNKYEFKDLEMVSLKQLLKIKERANDNLINEKNKRYQIIAHILFLEKEIEKEKALNNE